MSTAIIIMLSSFSACSNGRVLIHTDEERRASDVQSTLVRCHVGLYVAMQGVRRWPHRHRSLEDVEERDWASIGDHLIIITNHLEYSLSCHLEIVFVLMEVIHHVLWANVHSELKGPRLQI